MARIATSPTLTDAYTDALPASHALYERARRLFPDAVTHVLELVRGGMRLKEAAAEVSGETGHSSRELYQAALAVRG